MATNQNPANRAPGGNNRNQTNNPAQPKVEMRVRTGRSVVKDSCHFSIKVSIFIQRQPEIDREVILEEENSILVQDRTDNYGSVMFNIKEILKDEEQIKTLYISLPGTSDEKMISLIIPAKKKIKPTIKKFKVRIVSAVDAAADNCRLAFECSVLEDDKPFINQPVSLKKGLAIVDNGLTDNNGQVTFHSIVDLVNAEQSVTYRACLDNFPDEEEVNVTIPAAEPKIKEDNDPENLILMSHSDGCGHFKVKARVIKFKGVGLAQAVVSIWFKGNDYSLVTDDQGECFFNVPGKFKKGEEEVLTASVSGIEDQAKITLRRKKKIVKTFVEKLCKYVWLLSLALWILAILIGPGRPLINANLFRGGDGLSVAERFYNESAGVPVVEPARVGFVGGAIDFLQKSVWMIATIMIVLAIVWLVVVIIRAIYYHSEEAMESIFHKSYAKSGDPMFEQLAKYVGSYHAVNRKPATVKVDQIVSADLTSGANTASGANPENDHKHHSLLTFIGVDLIMEMALAIVKKVFFK